MLRLAGARPSSLEKGGLLRRRDETLQPCRDDEFVYAKRDAVFSKQ